MAKPVSIEVWNPSGKYRVVIIKPMPRTGLINLSVQNDVRLEICTEKKTILSVEDIIALIGDKCDEVIGQVEGFKMNLIYYDLYQSTRLQKFVTTYATFLKASGETPVTWKREATMDVVLQEAHIFLTKNGIYDFWNFFDDRTWYPLGGVIGGTVYPGLTLTVGTL